jgi:hypothetical protein
MREIEFWVIFVIKKLISKNTNFTIELYPHDHVHTWANGIHTMKIYISSIPTSII